MRFFTTVLFFCVISSSLTAKEVMKNGIAIKVNDDIITMYDIRDAQQKTNRKRGEVVAFLINQSLRKEAIKKENITVSDEEIDRFIDNVATQRRVSKARLRLLIQNQMSWESYREEIKKQIAQQSLQRKVIAKALATISEDRLKTFFNEHKKDFQKLSKIEVIAYTSPNNRALEQVAKNPMLSLKNVKRKRETFTESGANRKIFLFLSQVKERQFSPIVPYQKQFVRYFIQKKVVDDKAQVAYINLKNEVKNRYAIEYKDQFFKDYFQKMRANATIEYMR